MPTFPRRRILLLSALGLLLIGAGAATWFSLARRLNTALATPAGAVRPLQFNPLPDPALSIEHWGGGQVDALAAGPGTLLTAGGFGVMDVSGEVSAGLPTLHARALALWRGHAVVGLESGGVFLRREGRWEEARSGHGTLHVRCLLESPGGELWVGAQEGLFRTQWGASTLERLDAAPVRSLALGSDGTLLAGGETGLRQVDGGRILAIPTPDPWVDWVGLDGRNLAVVTPLGLARGTLGQPLVPQREGGDVKSAAFLGGQLYVVADSGLFRFDTQSRAAEERLPSEPRKVFASDGLLFADTDAGLYERSAQGWTLVRPRPKALPPGPCHVTALARMDSRLMVGLFDGGLAVGEADGSRWSLAPGASAWGINALLPAGGALYIASLRGGARYDGHQVLPLPEGQGAAFSLAETRDGVAIGFGQGLLLPNHRFLSAFHGLPGNQALALLRQDDLLFVGTPTGLGAVSGDKVLWRVTAEEGKLPHPWVTALALDGDSLLIGTYGGGVARRNPPKAGVAGAGLFTPYLETAGVKVNPGCLVQAGDRIYLGTDGHGLFRLSRDRERFTPLHLPLPSARITAILPDRNALYIGTDEGLARVPLPIPDEEP